MLNINNLKEFGADVDTGLSRCANNEMLYIRLVNMMLKELTSTSLGEALKENNLDMAFEIAHKLKGAVTNLAVTPISDPLCKLTDLLRNKTPGDYDSLYSEIVNKTNELASL